VFFHGGLFLFLFFDDSLLFGDLLFGLINLIDELLGWLLATALIIAGTCLQITQVVL